MASFLLNTLSLPQVQMMTLVLISPPYSPLFNFFFFPSISCCKPGGLGDGKKEGVIKQGADPMGADLVVTERIWCRWSKEGEASVGLATSEAVCLVGRVQPLKAGLGAGTGGSQSWGPWGLFFGERRALVSMVPGAPSFSPPIRAPHWCPCPHLGPSDGGLRHCSLSKWVCFGFSVVILHSVCLKCVANKYRLEPGKFFLLKDQVKYIFGGLKKNFF